MKWKYGSVNSLHQKPTGQPVVVDTAGLEMTIATRLGRAGLVGLKSLWLIVCSLLGQLVRVNWSGQVWSGRVWSGPVAGRVRRSGSGASAVPQSAASAFAVRPLTFCWENAGGTARSDGLFRRMMGWRY